MSKTRLAVLFGGVTVEHEVSVITGQQLINHVDTSRYQVVPIYIDKAGQWWTGDQVTSVEYFKTADLFHPQGLTPFSLSLSRGQNPIDAAILCFHGEYGEAGNVQGALELAGIPYQGPGVVSSAICFDKVVLRQILAAEGISQPRYVWFTREQWLANPADVIATIKTLTWPVFVKPANGVSTIGIEKVTTQTDLAAVVERVLKFDDRVMVEAEIKDCIEINVSVLGSHTQAQASVPEQPIKSDEFLSYADKYERGGKKSGMASASRRIPAPISSSLTQKVQELAVKIFQVLDCTGVVRIDFMVDPSEETVFVIEPNTIPGSMSFYLWEATGLPYSGLIDRLVEIAQERQVQHQQLTTSFASNILQKRQDQPS